MKQRMIYLQFTNPAAYPPLQHSSRILANKGWRILFLGTGSLGANALEFPPHPNIEVRCLPFVPGGWRQKFLYLSYLLWVLFWVIWWRPKWVYASDLLSCPVGFLISLLPGARVVYHEHDSPSEDSYQTTFIKVALTTRGYLAHRARFCMLPNQQRAQVFSAQLQTKTPIITVWNCPSLEELAHHNDKTEQHNQKLKIYYHGTIVPARVPYTIIEAIALLDHQVELIINGYETVDSEGYGTELNELAQRLCIGNAVTINTMGLPRRNQMLAQCRLQNVGLSLITKDALKDINQQYFVGASNKPFDYMLCGLALLVPNFEEWERAYVEPGYGLACNPEDPQSIAHALRWFIEHPEERREMGERGRRKIEEDWNYECQFQPILDRLSAC